MIISPGQRTRTERYHQTRNASVTVRMLPIKYSRSYPMLRVTRDASTDRIGHSNVFVYQRLLIQTTNCPEHTRHSRRFPNSSGTLSGQTVPKHHPYPLQFEGFFRRTPGKWIFWRSPLLPSDPDRLSPTDLSIRT